VSGVLAGGAVPIAPVVLCGKGGILAINGAGTMAFAAFARVGVRGGSGNVGTFTIAEDFSPRTGDLTTTEGGG
jgi:hypothetical protein